MTSKTKATTKHNKQIEATTINEIAGPFTLLPFVEDDVKSIELKIAVPLLCPFLISAFQ